MENLDQELARIPEGYRQALEEALKRVPARNGVVSVRDLWLETALPPGLIVELLETDGVQLPPHVVRVDLTGRPRRGRHGRKG
ncbi:MAG: hypothetical protein N2320_02500 [Candidatus Bipolaricaulota bacterium]|nr:hypothetical protein [Candidatus Bipolaricaulota bacterium]